MKKKRILTIIIGVLAAIAIAFVGLTYFFTDWLWFSEMGYVSVFFKELLTKLAFGVPAFLLLTAICYGYLMVMKRSYYKEVATCERRISEKRLNLLTGGLSMVFGLFGAVPIANNLWFQLLQFINSTDFNIADPIFGYDVSFYIFRLDFLSTLNQLLIFIIVAFIAINFVYYFILLSLRKPDFLDEPQVVYDTPKRENPLGDGIFGQMFDLGDSKGHSSFNKDTMTRLLSIVGNPLKILGVIFFLMLGLNFFIQQFTLLYTSSSGVVYGAGFTDITVKLWVYRILMALSLVSAALFVVAVNKRKLKTFLLIPAVMIGVQLLGFCGTLLVQNLVVSPDEISKESKYLENNIEFTRYAYDLQDIEIKQFSATNDLTAEDIANNEETISNIRINDYEPALKFYNQAQSIRSYYQFNDVDVDRYMVNGDYTQTFLSAREIDETSTGSQWLSNHLKYTHGYGITLSRVDKVTESGQPDMLIDSIPPVSDVQEIDITRPEIYFGESTNNYLVVNTDEKEFDYPSGDTNVYTEYQGDAGVKLNFINRLLFSIREGSFKLMVSTNIDSDSKIIINRNIKERIETIAPFLTYDDDPYIVTADGGLYWVVDAYTTSSYYPYSEPYSQKTNVNYIRNSVKVVVDAYNGDTSFYVVDPDDPIALTLQKIYPELFKDVEEMPESLKSHLRYPDTLFNIQSRVYAKYHMTDINVFYQNEDRWDIAKEIYGTEEVKMASTYYIMKLPGEEHAEFINSVPYTPASKNNMTALLVARNDGENYGNLILYQLPKDRIIYGPRQVEAQINQNTEIAQDFTLWESSGSKYTRGNMFVIPIEDSLMYVEPIYLESSNSSLPEVKRVIIYYNERIAYESTLPAALNSMFGDGSSDEPSSGEATAGGEGQTNAEASIDELAALAEEALNNALAAQKEGDWAAYGRYMDEVEDYLGRMVGAEASDEAAVEEIPQ